jgi:hypothetical protein
MIEEPAERGVAEERVWVAGRGEEVGPETNPETLGRVRPATGIVLLGPAQLWGRRLATHGRGVGGRVMKFAQHGGLR